MTARRTWILISLVLVIAVVLTIVFLPGTVGRKAVDEKLTTLQQRVGARIEYDALRVKFNSVTMTNVRLGPPGGQGHLVAVARVTVEIRTLALLAGRLEIVRIVLDEPVVDLKSSAFLSQMIRQLKSGGSADARSAGVAGSSPPPVLVLRGGTLQAQLGDARFRVGGIGGEIAGDERSLLDLATYEIQAPSFKMEGSAAELILGLSEKTLELSLNGPALRVLNRDGKALGAWIHELNHQTPEESGTQPTAVVTEEPSGAWREWLTGAGIKMTGATVSYGAVGNTSRDWQVDRVGGRVQWSKDDGVLARFDGVLGNSARPCTVQLKWSGEKEQTIGAQCPALDFAALMPLFPRDENARLRLGGSTGQFTLDAVHVQNERPHWSVDGHLAFDGVTVEHPVLAAQPVESLAFSIDLEGRWPGEERDLDLERLELGIGKARFLAEGSVNLNHKAFTGSISMPPVACNSLLRSIPRELVPRFEGVELSGQIGFNASLRVDTGDPEATHLAVDVDNRCRIAEYGDLPEPREFKRPFAYNAYTEDGNPLRLKSGPGTDRWVPLLVVSPFVIDTLMTTEDSKFWRHKGITVPEIRRALTLNMQKGGLYHGASTLTMQLAKNLLLSRERTISRKLQEIFLVWYLEKGFTKEELLELYLNVVEFGPSIYGLEDAAWHFFRREPYELNLIESVFLIKLLPSPVKRYNSYRRGRLKEKEYRMLRRVMGTMHSRGKISADELAVGLESELVFYRPGDPLPGPRVPIFRH